MEDHPITLQVKINMAHSFKNCGVVWCLGGQGAFRVGLLADSQRRWGCWKKYVSRAKGGFYGWSYMNPFIYSQIATQLPPWMTVFTEHLNLAKALGYPGWHWGGAPGQLSRPCLCYFILMRLYTIALWVLACFWDKVYFSHQVMLKTNKGNVLSTSRIVFFTGFKTSVSLILKVFFSGGISYMNKWCFCG